MVHLEYVGKYASEEGSAVPVTHCIVTGEPIEPGDAVVGVTGTRCVYAVKARLLATVSLKDIDDAVRAAHAPARSSKKTPVVIEEGT